MFIIARCFANKITFNKLPISFKFKDTDVIIKRNPISSFNIHEGLELEIRQKVNPQDLIPSMDNREFSSKNIQKLLKLYRSRLQEIAGLIEGLLSLMYFNSIPPFEAWNMSVNLFPENIDEEKLMEDKKISNSFGNIIDNRTLIYKYDLDEAIFSNRNINSATSHIPALSFFTQAFHSRVRGDEETAFFSILRLSKDTLAAVKKIRKRD